MTSFKDKFTEFYKNSLNSKKDYVYSYTAYNPTDNYVLMLRMPYVNGKGVCTLFGKDTDIRGLIEMTVEANKTTKDHDIISADVFWQKYDDVATKLLLLPYEKLT
jgi:hypothetical protein